MFLSIRIFKQDTGKHIGSCTQIMAKLMIEGGNQSEELYTCDVIGDLGMILNQRQLPTKGLRKHFAPLRKANVAFLGQGVSG